MLSSRYTPIHILRGRGRTFRDEQHWLAFHRHTQPVAQSTVEAEYQEITRHDVVRYTTAPKITMLRVKSDSRWIKQRQHRGATTDHIRSERLHVSKIRIKNSDNSRLRADRKIFVAVIVLYAWIAAGQLWLCTLRLWHRLQWPTPHHGQCVQRRGHLLAPSIQLGVYHVEQHAPMWQRVVDTVTVHQSGPRTTAVLT